MDRFTEISTTTQRAWGVYCIACVCESEIGSGLWSCRAKWNIGIVAVLLGDLQKPKCETCVRTGPSVGEASGAGVSRMGNDNKGIRMTGFVELVMVF